LTLQCICIDDEPLALGLVKKFIEQTEFLTLKGAYDSPLQAIQVLQKEQIDLVFLDIQMSDLTGIDLAKLLADQDQKPLIIFTTAFDQFAIEGYKLDAVDYLLKPFNYQEFLRAAMKAQSQHKLRNQSMQSAERSKDYIFLKVEYQLIKVTLADILYVEGLKDYVKVHVTTQSNPIISLSTLKSMEEALPSDRFYRIHRSYIVNLEKVHAISKSSLEIDKKVLTISENYRAEFHRKIGSGF
jgi:two-component system response regulator LytT